MRLCSEPARRTVGMFQGWGETAARKFGHDPVSILILAGAMLGVQQPGAAGQGTARPHPPEWREKPDCSGFSASGRHEFLASRAEGVRLCCPTRGSPSRVFPGTCSHCTRVLAGDVQNSPPAGWLLPKKQRARARAGCCLPVLPGQLPTGLSLLGIALLWENLLLGCREGAARLGLMQGCAQKLARTSERFWGMLVALDHLSQVLFIRGCMSRTTLLDIWKGLMMGRASQGEVLDGQRECDQKMLFWRILRHF